MKTFHDASGITFNYGDIIAVTVSDELTKADRVIEVVFVEWQSPQPLAAKLPPKHLVCHIVGSLQRYVIAAQNIRNVELVRHTEPEPPLFAAVVVGDGYIYQRLSSGWHATGDHVALTWEQVCGLRPNARVDLIYTRPPK